MRYKNEEAFAKAFKEEGARGVYLLYGAEEYLVDAWRSRISKPFAESGAFNLQKLEGRSPDWEALYDAVEAIPLMAAQKCVILEDMDLSKLPPKEADMLLDAVANTPEDCILILTGKAAFDPKGAAAKKLIKLVEDMGSAVELGARGPQGLVAFVKSAAKRCGCELPTALAHQLIERCGTDMNTLSNEVRKLCARAGYGPIDQSHVDDVIVSRTEARVFDLSKAILAGRTKQAMDILSDLFELRETPIAILSTLILSYVDLYRARAARDQGLTQAQFMELFAYKSEYRARNAYNGRLPAQALRRALEALQDCDRRMKSTGIDDRVLLEQTVTRLFMVSDSGSKQ